MFDIDGADEAIRHFIGIFHLAEERGRMRLDYDRLKPVQTDPDTGAIQLANQDGPQPYIPRDYQPDIPYAPPDPASEPLEAEPSAYPAEPFGVAEWSGRGGVDFPDLAPGAATSMPGFPVMPHGVGFFSPPVPVWVLPPPDSVVVIAIQKTALADDDQLSVADMRGGIVAPEHILARLDGLSMQASALGISLPVVLPADEPAFRLIAETFRQTEIPADCDTAPGLGAEIHARQGADVEGLYQDGQAIGARPDLADLMPEYQRGKAEEAAREARAADEAAARAVNEDGPSSAGPSNVATEPAPAPGSHELVYGANSLVNQASVLSAAITAPVVAVAAGVYSYNIISQTNVWSDIDTLSGVAGAGGGSVAAAVGGGATQALNLASFATFSYPMPDSTGTGEAPQYWVTATLEGSLISCNWIEQFNLMSDNDITSITLQAEQTLMLMGTNGAVNQISLKELGSSYDLIIVDGQIINLNAVLQTNVLLDDDRVMVSGNAGAEVGAEVGSGDNLLVNDASITQSGQNNIVATTADIDAMLAGAASGQVTLPQSVLEDPAFRDLPVVRVLHIEGDLVSVNILRQTNVLADSDQIEVYRDELMAAGDAVQVIAGSNVLVNAASIAEFGVDATIYSGGEVYSDALLLQAELISTDDPLQPGPGSGLASEAVLFLAEGMLGDDAEDALFQPIGADQSISADAMETVLT